MIKFTSLSIALLLTAAGFARAEDAKPAPFKPAFFAFQNGVSFGSLENEARTLKELGYDGINQVKHGGARLAARIAAYDKVGLKVLSIYLNVRDKPIAAEVVKPFENRGAMIELTVNRMPPTTVAAVRQTAEMAAKLKAAQFFFQTIWR